MKSLVCSAAALLLVWNLSCVALAGDPAAEGTVVVTDAEEPAEDQPIAPPATPPAELPRPGRTLPQPARQEAANAGCDATCDATGDCPQCGCCYCQCCGPRWTVIADIEAKWRSRARRQPMLELQRREFYNAADLDQGVAVGPRLGIIRHGCGGWDVELLYAGLNGWVGTESFPGLTATIPISPQLVVVAADPSVRYYSGFHNAEVNLRRPLCLGVTPLVGFRWLELHEDFRANGLVTGSLVELGVNADNHLYGFQLGAEATLAKWKGLRIDALMKGCLLGNSADQDATLSKPGVVTFYSASAAGSHTTFLGEVDLTAVCQLTNRMGVRVGYQAMWLEGVALAPNQLRNIDLIAGTAVIDTAGSLFYHGGYCGLELKW